MNTSLNVLICHETPLLAAGIAAALRESLDMAVVHCPDDVVASWGSGSFDVVVADYRRGVLCAGTSRITPGRPVPAPRVLIVTAQGSEWEIRHAIALGVHGYLLQGCSAAALTHAVRQVARGARCFDDEVSSRMAASLVHAALTQREHQVLRLLAGGVCNKTIADRLGIAVGTVKAHIKAILEKLHVKTRMQAAAVAEERGMLRVPAPVSFPRAAAAVPRTTSGRALHVV